MDLAATQLTSLPAEIGQLTSLTVLDLRDNQLTSLPAEIWAAHVADGVVPRRQSADELAGGDRAAHLAERLDLSGNQLTSVPAEIGQLTSLTELHLSRNQLTSLPAEIGQLTSLESWTSAAIS